MSELKLSVYDIDYILSARAIRDRAERMFQLTTAGKTSFIYHPDRYGATIEFVLSVIRENYPDLKIPFHSRWGHFRAGQVDRLRELDQRLSHLDPMERARCKLDLVITSVLLDAGAGSDWKYHETQSGQNFARSEGLGVASFRLFMSGALSGDGRTLRADREGLKRLTAGDLGRHFQVSSENPLVGLEGRAQLLNNLAQVSERPGLILDELEVKYGSRVQAEDILKTVLLRFGSIWPGRLKAQGKELGDTWIYSGFQNDGVEALIPFHKLSQWLTYSMIEPIVEAGFQVVGVERLTGLAEYRNGGLMLDSGLLSWRDPESAERVWAPSDAPILEWRGLTVYLLDRMAEVIQGALGKSVDEFPLAKVLEGGTWWAGRKLAAEKRPGGGPPVRIESDGTVF